MTLSDNERATLRNMIDRPGAYRAVELGDALRRILDRHDHMRDTLSRLSTGPAFPGPEPAGTTRAYVLYRATRGTFPDETDYEPVMVVFADHQQRAQDEADRMNLAYLAEHGELPAYSVVHAHPMGTLWLDET